MSEGNNNSEFVSVERYEAQNRQLMSTVEALSEANNRIAALEMDQVDAGRRDAIRALAAKYPEGTIDVEAEEKALLYSLGSDKTDEQASEHMATIERYAARSAPVTGMVPDGVFAEGPKGGLDQLQGPEKLRAGEAIQKETVKRFQAAAKSGDHSKDYDTIWAEVEAEIVK